MTSSFKTDPVNVHEGSIKRGWLQGVTAGETALPETIMDDLNGDVVGFDAETTGLNSARCELLSIAAVPSWGAVPFSICILPVGPVEAKAAEVNGYSPELWRERGAVTLKQGLWEFQRWLFLMGDRRFEMAAHNAGFDLLFILAAQGRTGIDLELPKIWHCTKIGMQEARWDGLIPVDEKENHLDDLGRLSGFWELEPRSKTHEALQDARCCVHGLMWLRRLRDGRPTEHAEVTEKREGGDV